MKKWNIMLFAALLVFGMIPSLYATNTGDTHALEGMAGGKYSGAPSQAIAGRLGVTFEHLRDAIGEMMLGVIENPAKLKEFGYELKKGDKVELKRVEENKWELKLISLDKTATFIVK